MAKKVVYVDDVTGKEIAEGEGGPVTFSLNGEFFQLDIAGDTLAKLEKALKPYIEVATVADAPQPEPAKRSRTAKRTAVTTTGRGGSGLSREELDAARQWLRSQGHEVSDRGRIKGELLDLYEKAHH